MGPGRLISPRGPRGASPQRTARGRAARPRRSLAHVTTSRPSSFTASGGGCGYLGDWAWVATVAKERVEEKAVAAGGWGGDRGVQAAGGPAL